MTDERLQELYGEALAARPPRGDACPAPEALLALARREGDEATRLETLDHVMSCGAGCRRELDLLRAMEHAAAAAPDASAPDVAVGAAPAPALRVERGGRRTVRRWRGWYVPAAAAAALVLAVGVGRLPRRDGRAEPRGDELRDAGDAAVALVAPADGGAVAAGATLAWHPLPGAVRYTVELLDDQGAVALAGETADTTFALARPLGVAPGDYRWWVRARSDDGAERHSALRRVRVGAG